MTTYILLRSNKETGPFQLEQLREMGLKANDLIWVEGQSASWRNPGEINELRNLVVSASPAQTPNKVETNQAAEERFSDTAKNQTPDPGKRHIFVALPADLEKSPFHEVNAVASAPAVLKDPEEFEPVEKPKEEIETKYAMSLDEIKERYVKTLENRKSSRRGISFEIPESIKRAAVYAGVFILGAAIVLLLVRPNPSGPVAGEQKKLPASFENNSPTDEVAASNSDPESEIMLPESYYDSQSSGEAKEYISTEESQRKTPVQQKTSRPVEKEEDEPVEDKLEERVPITRDETPEIRDVKTSDIAEQVSVKANSYTIAALGGIRDLELTIRNGSDFILDKVTVEVRYLNPKGVIVKTEDVQFKSIQPNGTQTIGMKKSNRGVKVTHKIIRVESKEFDTHIAGN